MYIFCFFFHFRNTVPEMVISILLALGVCLLGSVLLAHDFFHDFAIFWLCFVIAGCQYSLLKVCSLPLSGIHIASVLKVLYDTVRKANSSEII